jgi:TRAP-type C4-dicarboxylate transport system permease small subunit
LFLGAVLAVGAAVLFGLAGLLHLLPRLLPVARRMYRWILVGSYYLFSYLLGWLAPWVWETCRIDILHRRWRVALCALLSVGLGWGLLSALHWPMGWVGLILLAGHGLTVGTAWQRLIGPPEGLHLGEVEDE